MAVILKENDPFKVKRAQALKADPGFAAWFGNSGVRDENGLPYMCYHATTKEFSEFRVGSGENGVMLGRGIYVATSPDVSFDHIRKSGNGCIHPLYLKAECLAWEDDVSAILFAEGGLFYDHLAMLKGWSSAGDAPEDEDLDFDPDDPLHMQAQDNALTALREREGFDGIIGRWNGAYQIMVFSPDQLRHAYELQAKYGLDDELSMEEDGFSPNLKR
jgi:hypothetical protein